MGSDEQAPVAIVTGGAIRVGRAILEALVGAGYRVWLHHHRSIESAQALQHELGTAVVGTIAADLLDEAERVRLIDTITHEHGPAAGRVDLLVNNAASFERGLFTERTDSDLRRVLELNLVAPVALIRGFVPALERTGGSVVNIVDVAGFHPWRGYVDHCISKAGLLMATRALAVELAPLRVNGVAPGTVAWPTDAIHASSASTRERIESAIPLGRIGEPTDVAQAVLFLAGASFVSGHVIAVDGGRLAAAGRGQYDPG